MLELSPQLWNWYAMFLVTMGAVLAVTISLGIALLAIDWCYLYAKNIEQSPTPISFPRAFLNLSRFQALGVGILLAPFCGTASYYLLFGIVIKLAPHPVDAPPLQAIISICLR